MSGVLLADRYLSSMTEADLDEVAAIEKLAYEFPWSRGNFQDSLQERLFRRVHAPCDRNAGRLLRADAGRRRDASAQSVRRAAAQHAGAGLALLREAVRITRAEKLDGVLLEVRPSNPRAIQLYERFGFSAIGRRKNYYPARHRSREDAIVMRLSFSKEGAHGAA